MLNPLSLPVELLQRLNAIAEAVERLPAIERLIEERLDAFERRLQGFEKSMGTMPKEMERELRPHMLRQAETAEGMAARLANLDERIPGGNRDRD